jgi:hypothetical protein
MAGARNQLTEMKSQAHPPKLNPGNTAEPKVLAASTERLRRHPASEVNYKSKAVSENAEKTF